MRYQYHSPHPELSAYIRTVLTLEGQGTQDDYSLPLVTNGMPVLLCRTENDQVQQLSLYGRSAPAEAWEVNTRTTLVAYFFKPFTMACIFNIPASRFKENLVELDSWNPHVTHALKLQLNHAPETSQKVQALDHFLLNQLQQQKRECEIIRYASDQIMYNSGKEVPGEILKELNLNERTFQRIFKKYIGITPGQYRRICQFQLSFSQLKAGEYESMMAVAYDNGFADQSHFIRSFKEFTQMTPKDYVRSGLKKKKT